MAVGLTFPGIGNWIIDRAKEKPYSDIISPKILPNQPLPQDGLAALMLMVTSFVVLLNIEVNTSSREFMEDIRRDSGQSLSTSVDRAIKEVMTVETLKALHYHRVEESSECIKMIKGTLKRYFTALDSVDVHRKEVLLFLINMAMEQQVGEVVNSFQNYSNYSIANQLKISRLLAHKFSSYHIIETHIWDPNTKWTKEFKKFADELGKLVALTSREYTLVVEGNLYHCNENIEKLNCIYEILSSYRFTIYHCELENVRDGTTEGPPAPSFEVYGEDVALFLNPSESYTGGKTIPVKIGLLAENPKAKVFLDGVMNHRTKQDAKLTMLEIPKA
jgi:hypothetical protein